MSRRARRYAMARPWEILPTTEGPDVDALLKQVQRFPSREPTEQAPHVGPAATQDRARTNDPNNGKG